MKKNKKNIFIAFLSVTFLLFLIIKIAYTSDEIDPKNSLEDFFRFMEEQNSPQHSDEQINLDSSNKSLTKGSVVYESWWDEEGEPLEKNQKQIFKYYGSESDCNTLGEEKNELCLKNGFSYEQCLDYMNKEIKICRSKYPFWGPGTTEIAGNLAIEGFGLIFNSSDSNGMHWIMSSLTESLFNSLGFSKKEQSIFFGQDIYLEKDFIMNQDNNNSIYINDNTKIEQNNIDMKISIFDQTNINLLYDEDPPKTEKEAEDDDSFYRINLYGGLSVVGDILKTDSIIYKNYYLTYCSPSTGECYTSNRAHNENFIFASGLDEDISELPFNKPY